MTEDAFFSRPEVVSAIDRLAARCFSEIEEHGGILELPTGPEFLSANDIEGGEVGTLTLAHTVHPEGVAPQAIAVIPCPDGGTGYRYDRCQTIKGKQHCVVVCHCPQGAS